MMEEAAPAAMEGNWIRKERRKKRKFSFLFFFILPQLTLVDLLLGMSKNCMPRQLLR